MKLFGKKIGHDHKTVSNDDVLCKSSRLWFCIKYFIDIHNTTANVAPVVTGSNVRMRVHELRYHISSGREQISLDNLGNPSIDEPESSLTSTTSASI